MKTKIFLSAVVLLLGTSCKKLYTCSCNTTSTSPNASGSLVIHTKVVQYNVKMTKTQATSACKHEQASVKETEEQFFAAIGASVTANTSCVIQ